MAHAELRALRQSITRAESLTILQDRPRSASAAVLSKTNPLLLKAPPPRPDDRAVLSRWVQRRLAPFHSADEAEGHEHEAAAWRVPEVLLWLRCSAGLEQYSVMFEAHAVDGAALLRLDDSGLLDMGMRLLGHRKRMLRAIEELRQRLPSVPASIAAAAPFDGGGAASAGASAASGGSQVAEARRRARQRKQVAALGECVQKVLSHCPSLPLHSRQLLLSLVEQQGHICLESLAAADAHAEAQRRREAEQVPRRQARVRARLEALLVAAAAAEDRAEEAARRAAAAVDELRGLDSLRWEHQEALIELEALRAVAEDLEEARALNLLHRRTILGHGPNSSGGGGGGGGGVGGASGGGDSGASGSRSPSSREGGASPAGSLQADAVQLAGELGAAEPEVSATTEHESQAPVLRQDLIRDLY